jgi:glyoxylase-like metal-dependent hydrolase (beta-lactamase superfamily II)
VGSEQAQGKTPSSRRKRTNLKQITPNVYVETEFVGSNVSFVTTGEGVVMVDSPMLPTDALEWRGEIIKRGKVRYLINTEHHPDHIAGNYFFSGIVVSSEETKREISLLPIEELRKRVSLDPEGHGSYLFDHCHYRIRVPEITYSDKLYLYLGNHTLELFHLPGHTLGQSVVYIPKEKVLMAGDNLTNNAQVFFHDAEPFLWLDSLRRIDELDVDFIVPGHGEVCGKSSISELSSFIQEWMDAVRQAISQGLTKEEAMMKISFLDRYPMPSLLKSWGPEIQRWNVSRLYDVLIHSR